MKYFSAIVLHCILLIEGITFESEDENKSSFSFSDEKSTISNQPSYLRFPPDIPEISHVVGSSLTFQQDESDPSPIKFEKTNSAVTKNRSQYARQLYFPQRNPNLDNNSQKQQPNHNYNQQPSQTNSNYFNQERPQNSRQPDYQYFNNKPDFSRPPQINSNFLNSEQQQYYRPITPQNYLNYPQQTDLNNYLNQQQNSVRPYPINSNYLTQQDLYDQYTIGNPNHYQNTNFNPYQPSLNSYQQNLNSYQQNSNPYLQSSYQQSSNPYRQQDNSNNPFLNFFNNLGIGNINTRGGGFGGQFTRALDEISRNDDQQCVPKLICMMTKYPGQQLPISYGNRNLLKMVLMTIPTSNPVLNFSRAALLGFGVGDNSCDSAFPQCPRDEEKILHYLNNHRGGFFRLFNEQNQ